MKKRSKSLLRTIKHYFKEHLDFDGSKDYRL
jgi:hypothetical protein